MEAPAIIKLQSFLLEQLDVTSMKESCDGYYYFKCSLLPFDIYVILGISSALESQNDKRKIKISLGQLEHQFEKIKYRLKVLAGKAKKIYARSTVIARVDKKQSLLFQEEHHLQVPLPGKYRYGLFHHGELVSIAIFSGGRKMQDTPEDYRSFELLRFCHKSDYLVIGGLSKLLQGFIKDFNPGDIMTYVDLDWSQDSSLKTIGFEEKGTRKGENFWISNNRHYIIEDENHLQEIRTNHPDGFIIQNTGSIKLVLAV